MLKKALIGIAAVVAIFLVVVSLQAPTYSVERKKTIHAPADVIYPELVDLRRENKWSPWTDLDPNMKQTYSGPEVGVGSVTEWEGNKDAGKGRMTITDAKENERVELKIEFFEPMNDVAKSVFALAPAGADTTVSWTMSGDKNFVAKAMCMFMDMDKMLGKDFEKGLDRLAAITEANYKAKNAPVVPVDVAPARADNAPTK